MGVHFFRLKWFIGSWATQDFGLGGDDSTSAVLWISKEALRRLEQSENCSLSLSAFVILSSCYRGNTVAYWFAILPHSKKVVGLMAYYTCVLFFFYFFTCFMTEILVDAFIDMQLFYPAVVCFVEKLSTVLWTRALLPKQHCQHTPTRCWAHTTRRMTSLSAKQVKNGSTFEFFFYFRLSIYNYPPFQRSPPILCVKGTAVLFPILL